MTTLRLWLACSLFSLAACEEEAPVRTVPIGDLDGGMPSAPDDSGRPDTSCRDPYDLDCDGYGLDAGDCDDNDPRRGPSAIELPANGIDEDCTGGDVLIASSCDAELDPEDDSAGALAKALGLCTKVTDISGKAGLIKVRWRRLNGSDALADPRQVWLPERFGRIGAREGRRMVVLSTGVARDADERDYTPECDVFGGGRVTPALDAGADAALWRGGVSPPEGFPRDSTRCKSKIVSEGRLAYDDVGVELTFQTPSNATALAFDSMFFTYEYPDSLCQEINDFFVAIMDDAPREFEHDNILVDQSGDPVGVNTALLSVCAQARRERLARDIECAPNSSELLIDTGFGREEANCATLSAQTPNIGGASTGWLHTEVPVAPLTEVTLTFRLWDSGNPLLDSTVLLDNFRFLAAAPQTGTRPITSR
jgi:hypothetical protein